MNYKMILFVLGKIMIIGAGLMAPSLAVSFIYHDGCHWGFIAAMVMFLLLGAMALIRPKRREMFSKEAMVTVSAAWILFSIIGGVPFFLTKEIPSFVDCVFEMVSGFTTTGSSILPDVEALSKSLLFWRSFTHWVGGMGVLAFVMAIVSQKDGGTNQLMRAEMPGLKVGKLASKWQYFIRVLYLIYIALSAIEFVLLLFGGMSVFDSLLHTFGTAGTGGFGIKSDSVAYYDSAYIDYVIGIFMALFGVNFSIYYMLCTGKTSQALKNDEVKIYLVTVIVSTFLIALNVMSMYSGFGEAVRYSFFQVSSIITTTGYSTTDFNLWPTFSKAILVILMFFGSCAGSTAGGMKIIRVTVLFKASIRAVKRAVSSRSVVSIRNDGKPMDKETINGVFVYFIVYMMLFAVSILIVSLDNFDMTTTVTSVVATLNNIGPGLGAVGPMGNFADFSLLSKLVLALDMLAGRLELYPILILFTPVTWKK